jgi:hypothetical protein
MRLHADLSLSCATSLAVRRLSSLSVGSFGPLGQALDLVGDEVVHGKIDATVVGKRLALHRCLACGRP